MAHEGIGGREQLVLQAQRMQLAQPSRGALVGKGADPGLHEGAVEAEIDLGDSRRRCKPALVFLAVAAERTDIVERARFEAHEIVAADQVRRLVVRLLLRHHRLVEARWQDFDQIDVARELVMLLLGDRTRNEDAEMPG